MNYLVLGLRKWNFDYLVIGQRRIDGSFGQGGQGYEQDHKRYLDALEMRFM